ncbi:MAG: zinc-dependent metalloprotease family protein [Candidatus Jordarchaeaceae archaeon]
MKKMASFLVILISLLITTMFTNISTLAFSIPIEPERLLECPDIQEEPMSEPPPEGTPYTNTTFAQPMLSAWDYYNQWDDYEGNNPIYVVVLLDEEELATQRDSWLADQYAILTLERADSRYLIPEQGIDIRILRVSYWDSDDSKTTMLGLFDELKSEQSHLLHQWHEDMWYNYVDVVVGITNQQLNDDIKGVASSHSMIDKGENFILFKWHAYWANDNLVAHEFAHLFYGPDHFCDIDCVQSREATYVTILFEEGAWYWVWSWVPKGLVAGQWCSDCKWGLNLFRLLHQEFQYKLVIRDSEPWLPYATYGPLGQGVFTENLPATLTVNVISMLKGGYMWSHWELDGVTITGSTSVTFAVTGNHALVGYVKPAPLPPIRPRHRGGPRWCYLC